MLDVSRSGCSVVIVWTCDGCLHLLTGRLRFSRKVLDHAAAGHEDLQTICTRDA